MDDQQMRQIWVRFNSNIGSLWIFADKISTIADDEDQKQLSRIAGKVATLIDGDKSEVEEELRQFIYIADETEVEPDITEKPEVKEIIDACKSGEFALNTRKWLRRYPQKRNQFVELWRSILDPQSTNGIILRRSAFVLLVSFYETLLVDLLTAYFGVALPSKSDERIINRGTFPDRLDLLSKAGIVISPFEDIKKIVVEIILRRNLFTHNNGIIDQAYINNIPGKNPSLVVGRRLRISDKYLQNSIENIYLFGYLIFQTCWRIWVSGNYKQADLHYADTLFLLLRQSRNHLVELLASRENNFKIVRREHQIIIINHAIALRDMDMKDEARKLLDTEIRSPANQIVGMALHILKEEYESAFILLIHIIKDRKIGNVSGDWPLFTPVLSDQRFIPWLKRLK